MSTLIIIGLTAIVVLAVIFAVSVATAYYILKDPMLQDPKRGDRQ